ncbi:MAG: hypothetical protein P8175_12815 [Deltaproteobacteria bacterium]|jgi:hypothetical protein
MADEKKRQIDHALDNAGLQKGRIVIGTYDTGYRTRVGVYFHFNFTEKLANALIQLALQDKMVHEGIGELRQNFDLILTAVESAKPLKAKKRGKQVH